MPPPGPGRPTAAGTTPGCLWGSNRRGPATTPPAGLFIAARSANKDAMPYVLMFAAMLMLTMLVACVVSV
ncbi:hypothetical protein Rmf_47510 [Roseomonas fluvialis]|uniref:Uncharacterized protein n=1 Tax=Roseomonas fluvialis TaxID=1750527 RepID=A0ABM7Y9W9_9PROT|nr:hypothetical protein Rmf_47510 [Roseomonas fluvialis]